MKNMLKKYLLILILHKIFVVSIHITHMSVPSTVAIGQRGILNCTWTLDNGTLYLLKWNKGNEHFYSWSPVKDSPKVYPVEGISIDSSKSVGGYVEFIATSTKAANMYRCEVTADTPPVFHTHQLKKRMKVLDLPDVRPNLTLENISYKMYDNITVGCNSIKAFPDPKINFFLNNESIDQSHINLTSFEDEITGLKTIEANFTFVLKPYMVANRKLKIKCTAEINEVYWETSEIEFPGDHLLDWENTEIQFRNDFEQYDYQKSRVSRNQSNWIINLLVVMIHLMLQASLFVNSF